jgi:hypothetical protein
MGGGRRVTRLELLELMMDEVEAMTRAGETVGRAVGTGLHAMRVQATRAGQTGGTAALRAVRRAELRLAEQGIAPGQLSDMLSETADRASDQAAATTRRATKKAAKRMAKQRRRLSKQAAGVRADAERKRTEMVRNARRMRRQTAKQATEARRRAKRAKRDYTAQLGRARRRWPWLLGVLAAGVGAVLFALSRRPQEVRLTEVTEEPELGEAEQLPPAQRGPAAGEATRPRQQRKP